MNCAVFWHIHAFAQPTFDFMFDMFSLFSRSDMLQETHLLDEDSSSESQTDEEAFLDVVADIIDLSDKTISIEDVWSCSRYLIVDCMINE